MNAWGFVREFIRGKVKFPPFLLLYEAKTLEDKNQSSGSLFMSVHEAIARLKPLILVATSFTYRHV